MYILIFFLVTFSETAIVMYTGTAVELPHTITSESHALLDKFWPSLSPPFPEKWMLVDACSM
jgi:hypothetical protein